MKRLFHKFGKIAPGLLPGMTVADPWRRTIIFAGHETSANTVSSSTPFNLRFNSTGTVVGVRPLGARQQPASPEKTSSRNRGDVGKNQGQG